MVHAPAQLDSKILKSFLLIRRVFLYNRVRRITTFQNATAATSCAETQFYGLLKKDQFLMFMVTLSKIVNSISRKPVNNLKSHDGAVKIQHVLGWHLAGVTSLTLSVGRGSILDHAAFRLLMAKPSGCIFLN